jgi:hypothetical protein
VARTKQAMNVKNDSSIDSNNKAMDSHNDLIIGDWRFFFVSFSLIGRRQLTDVKNNSCDIVNQPKREF